jgi:formylglycine-generating enzyme required for sulfatase activity
VAGIERYRRRLGQLEFDYIAACQVALQGDERVVRGGSWTSLPQDLRAAYRYAYPSILLGGDIGFRLARTLNP